MNFWITPVRDIEHIIDSGKKDFKKRDSEKFQESDWILFYHGGQVLGHARFVTIPVYLPELQKSEEHKEWSYYADMDNIVQYSDPVDLTETLRGQLEWFEGDKAYMIKNKWQNLVIGTTKL